MILMNLHLVTLVSRWQPIIFISQTPSEKKNARAID
uniref:Uncharacterized protein n=1 Tax=Arundo donax TaxID=35708 RepID=A0A0A9A3I2_ARUDO